LITETEQPEKSQNNRKTGTIGKPERPGTPERLGNPERLEKLLRQYIDGTNSLRE
jgi:hypothetical protein